MKYIDADFLKSKLKDVATEFKTGNYYLDNSEQAVGYENALIDFEQIIDSLQQEQTEVNLDAEIEKELRLHYNDDQDVYWWNYLKNSFRHFYELGKKDAEREINKELIKAMEKVHEIRDVDYDIHVDTSADGSFETISYYENGKLVGQERSKK